MNMTRNAYNLSNVAVLSMLEIIITCFDPGKVKEKGKIWVMEGQLSWAEVCQGREGEKQVRGIWVIKTEWVEKGRCLKEKSGAGRNREECKRKRKARGLFIPTHCLQLLTCNTHNCKHSYLLAGWSSCFLLFVYSCCRWMHVQMVTFLSHSLVTHQMQCLTKLQNKRGLILLRLRFD